MPPRGPNLADLVIAAQAGDPRAWEALVTRLSPLLAAMAKRRGLSHADQADVAQRTWLRAVERAGSLREPAAFAGWLAAIARRECANAIAQCTREFVVAEPAGADATASDDVHAVAEAAERRAALLRSLRRLTPGQRTLVLALVAASELSYDELALALGMRRGSVGATRQRALARLREDPDLAAAVLND